MIIDFHTHVFPDRIAAATVEALKKKGNIPAHSDGTVDGLIERMNESGVDISLNLPVVTKATQFDGIFKFANEISSTDFGEKRIISFAGIHPDCEDVEEKLAKIMTNDALPEEDITSDGVIESLIAGQNEYFNVEDKRLSNREEMGSKQHCY